jgi:transposase
MYLRRNRRLVNGSSYQYWTLVESVRTGKGPRQRIVATLGKLPSYDAEERVGWDEVGRILSDRPARHPELFPKEAETPEWAAVNLRNVSVERLRDFGDVFLALAVWKRLHLDEAFERLPLAGREEIGWDAMACILAVARFCQPGSELALAERWYGGTALEDLLGVPAEKINDDRLYRALDRILPHREEICRALQARYADWFGTTFDFLFYDVTSTYFEGLAAGNPQARRGYSRDHRPDCGQVCIGLVVTTEGLPVAYEVFNGNRPDVTTLSDIMQLMESKYGKARRVWVFDRGIASEENLDELRNRGAQYLVGTPRGWLRKFEQELTDQGWTEVRDGLEVKTVRHPDGGTDTFVLCRSRDRAEKERAMLRRQLDRLESKLTELRESIRKGRVRSAQIAERRIGRWLGRFPVAEGMLHAELVCRDGVPADLVITRREECREWAELAHGAYLLRTNLDENDPTKLWQTYMNLNQAEQAFRISKSDLGLRPVWHQREDRVQAHIFVCFLALAMWRSLEQWMSRAHLGTCARLLLEAFRTIRSVDVVLPVQDHPPVRLRVVSRPEPDVLELLHKLGLKVPNTPKRIVNVVEKTALPDHSPQRDTQAILA